MTTDPEETERLERIRLENLRLEYLRLEHLSIRPSWDCAACGQPWPCANAKTRLLTEFADFPSVLAIYMSSQMHEAFIDLTAHGPLPPADLYDRFLGWIRHTLTT